MVLRSHTLYTSTMRARLGLRNDESRVAADPAVDFEKL